jgi:hypothetical protein
VFVVRGFEVFESDKRLAVVRETIFDEVRGFAAVNNSSILIRRSVP